MKITQLAKDYRTALRGGARLDRDVYRREIDSGVIVSGCLIMGLIMVLIMMMVYI